MYTSEEKQTSFNSSWFEVPTLDQQHTLYKIANLINWDFLSEKLSKFYHKSLGRPTKHSRVKVGLLILKHLYKLSDRETIEELKSNLYAQYLCDINPRDAHSFIDYSTLCVFRKDIGVEGAKIIENEVFAVLKKLNLLKGKKSKRLIADTTCVASPIQYPTDINLLETCRRKVVNLLDKAKPFGLKAYRTYKRVAKKTYLQYQKLRRVSKNIRRKTQKKLLQFVRRNLKQLQDAIKKIKIKPASKLKEQFLLKAKEVYKKVKKIFKQQKEIYRGNSVKNRIVSFWAQHIRPIVRGKYPVEVEFGPKVLLSNVSKFLFFDKLCFDNTSDINLFDDAILSYKNRFGSLPSEAAADRGFYSIKNIVKAKEYGIKNVAIQKKGNITSRDKPPAFVKRLKRLCCAIESKISLAKRKFGLERINYRIPDGEEIWIRLSVSVMNLKFATDYG